MLDLNATDYSFARFVIERGLGLIYLIAFVVAAKQFPALCGERGLEPAAHVLSALKFRQAPSLFHWGYSDRRLRLAAGVGAALAVAIVLGLPQRAPLPITMLTWLALWALYQSIVNVGGTFYGFGWETMLLEAGFLAIFLGNAEVAPPWPILLAFRWVAFRAELGAGLIKLRGDPCWRKLTCMDYHHETQPLPNPLSLWFHHLPRGFHRLEVVGNFAVQLALPFALFLPQPAASIAAGLMIASQLYLVISGNYAWLNWLTILLLVAGLSDPVLGAVVPWQPAGLGPAPAWFLGVVLAVSALLVFLSYWPVRNLLSRRQAMNASFNPFHLVNTYGAFGSVSRHRLEVIVEGTASPDVEDESQWREYEFKAKPGRIDRVPPQIAPYHLRLDWLMWFIPLRPRLTEGWFLVFLIRLLEADRPTLALLRGDPFGGQRPAFVRARLFLYRFATRAERVKTGAIWERLFVSEFVPPISLRPQEEVFAWAAPHEGLPGTIRSDGYGDPARR